MPRDVGHKIRPDPRTLRLHLDRMRTGGKTIVSACGCFDLLHVGHVRYLNAARALGDVLVVAVNTDASMRAVKGRAPVNGENERFEVIAALEAVDFVVPLPEQTPCSLLELLRPHIHTKGTDYTLDRIPERTVVERSGGRVELVGGAKEHSTSDMLRAIRRAGP